MSDKKRIARTNNKSFVAPVHDVDSNRPVRLVASFVESTAHANPAQRERQSSAESFSPGWGACGVCSQPGMLGTHGTRFDKWGFRCEAHREMSAFRRKLLEMLAIESAARRLSLHDDADWPLLDDE